MSAGFSKQFEVEGEKQAVVLQLTVLKWGRAVMGRGLPSTIEDCEGLPRKKFNFGDQFLLLQQGCKSLFTNTGVIQYMYA